MPLTTSSTDTDLSDIHEKVMDKQRLTYEDGLRLFASQEILTIGYLANIVRERLNKHYAYYVINRHINYTNICKNSCKFCAFSRTQESDDAFLLSIDKIREKVRQIIEDGATELHIVGGLHPDIELDYYLSMIQSLHDCFPTVHLKAFTAVEIVHFAEMKGTTTAEILRLLKSAGLGSLPGGGAEIFAGHIRDELCPEKVSGEVWLNTMREAHNLGLRSNATLLYGHIEDDKDRINHLLQLRELQDETNGFMSFIPLAFHPKNTELQNLSDTQGILDLKMLAISRLMLDNFDHIKAYWIMLGIKLAQVSLNFGVDDIDGTVIEEKITHSAGAKTPESLTVNQIRSLIEETGHEPVERDTIYNHVIHTI
ncbi:MAG: aminofutalosine synthase MqnE [Candidatus Scalindua sp. AMX11]|nr:MAG: aminofutalosine synthase MqnE [Candidatus Scalindua sp.]NOG83696.1 aminofutalosine synthase MqnE [Planctomycetota bacterium]RZV73854.1 MAG: aminofutalosine synthase MqnE [Candidatus Scalindua sp. SCAELEC01]TDE64861.1 MAG: aminofutalosine synthase MqnE [Candidatus Scalindua sp. AMX11]GJQ60647.1 MAG: aminodeoxyfutalosine synthase [Candidatus Scalindua sp.]